MLTLASKSASTTKVPKAFSIRPGMQTPHSKKKKMLRLATLLGLCALHRTRAASTSSSTSRARGPDGRHLLSQSVESQPEEPAVLTVVDYAPWTYRARVSLPHGDDTPRVNAAGLYSGDALCRAEVASDAVAPSDSLAVGVLLSEKCSARAQLTRALELRGGLTPSLGFVVIPGQMDGDLQNHQVPTVSSILRREDDDVDERTPLQHRLQDAGIMIISISPNSGASIRERIEKLQLEERLSSQLFHKLSKRWHLPIILELSPVNQFDDRHDTVHSEDYPFRGADSHSDYRNSSENFYWFRFVLFSLLIIAPLARGVYLWWAGGGRLLWRRDAETGRIVGIQYVPPVSYWYATTTRDGGSSEKARTLTEDQVMAIPEIVYRGDCGKPDSEMTLLQTSSESESDGAFHLTGTFLRGSSSSDDHVVSSGSSDRDDERIVSSSRVILDSELQRSESDVCTTIEDATSPSTPLKSCTACSICIDDFEHGERLRLLPRCRHAYHLECLKPWLMERQGCCPTCKTNVLECHDGDTEGDTENEDASP